MSEEKELTPREIKRKEFLDYLAMLIGKKEDVELMFPLNSNAEVDMVFDLLHKEVFHNGRGDIKLGMPKGVGVYYLQKIHFAAAKKHVSKKQAASIRKRLFKK